MLFEDCWTSFSAEGCLFFEMQLFEKDNCCTLNAAPPPPHWWTCILGCCDGQTGSLQTDFEGALQ
jgi:hypothetical protein